MVFLPFLELLPQHMEVPRLGVQSELQLPAYARVTETREACMGAREEPEAIKGLRRGHWKVLPGR